MRLEANEGSMRHDVVGAILWLVLSGTALGQTFAQGNQLYQRGDFAGADKVLTAALKIDASADDRAKTFKLLGICQYMLGEKKAATESFVQATKLKPGIQISANEVLDDTVIPFFQRSYPVPVTAPTASVAAGGVKPKKGTFLRVQTTPANATILLDGIIAGTGGNAIEVDGGQVEIEVQAKGYVSQRTKVNVVKDRENGVTVTLQKPKPKAKPAAVAKKKQPKAKKPKDDDLFLPPVADEFAEARDPAAEFEREAQTGYAPQQGVPQGAQLAYTPNGQPVYIMMPQQGQIYSPPPPPPPPGGEAEPYYAPPPEGTAATPDPAERAPASAKASDSKNNLLITLLPFGAGQFQNGSYLLGTAFLAGEVYAIYSYLSIQPRVAKDTKDRNAFVNDKNDKGEEFSDDDKSYVAKADRSIKMNKQNIQYAQIGFGALWAVGVVQALVAERYLPAQNAKDKKARKQRKYGGFSYVVPDDIGLSPALARDVSSGSGLDLAFDLRWEL